MSEPTSLRVLLADDDAILQRLLEVNFRTAGIELESVGRGDDALARVVAAPPDVLILDATLPGLDGHEVYRRIREDESLADLPVIFLTGRSPEEFRAYVGDRVRVVTKPFDLSDLLDVVRGATGTSA